MPDVTPNYRVEIQRIKSNIAAQQANIERQRLEILEMVDRKGRHEENILAAQRAIADLEQQLAQLSQAHGELTEEVYLEMAQSLGES